MQLYNSQGQRVGEINSGDELLGGIVVVVAVCAGIIYGVSALYSFLGSWSSHYFPYSWIMAYYYFFACVAKYWVFAFPVIWKAAFALISTPFPNLNLTLDWLLALLAVLTFTAATLVGPFLILLYAFDRWGRIVVIFVATVLLTPGCVAIICSSIGWLFARG